MTDLSAARAAIYSEADSGTCLVEKFPTDPVTALCINDNMVKRTFDTWQCRAQVKAVPLAYLREAREPLLANDVVEDAGCDYT